MWPAVWSERSQSPAETGAKIPERWVIVDGTARREVSERDFRGALGACTRVVVGRCPADDDTITHIAYR